MGAVWLVGWVMGVLAAVGVFLGSRTIRRSGSGLGLDSLGVTGFLGGMVDVEGMDSWATGGAFFFVGTGDVFVCLTNTRADLAARGDDGGRRVVIFIACGTFGIGSDVRKVILENRSLNASRTGQ